MENQLLENIDYVVCQICKEHKEAIAGPHLKRKHGMTSKEYQEMFPGYRIASDKYGNKVSPKGREDHHMKRPEMRKLSSERCRGDSNPNSKTKSSQEDRNSRSPYHIDFYKKRFPDSYEEEYKKFQIAQQSNINKRNPPSNKIEYWLNLGFSEEEAQLKLKDRQTTFSLEKCIEKYGEKEGRERFDQRQKKWKHKVFNENTHIGLGKSNISEEIWNYLKSIFPNALYGKAEKFIKIPGTNKAFKFDFCLRDKKKIIEFNGTFWHCKPSLYEETYFHNVKKKTAKEIWDYDKVKIDLIKSKGYDVLTVWEDDYKKDKEGTLKKCVDFLND